MACFRRRARFCAALACLLALGCAALLSPGELRVDAVAIDAVVEPGDPAAIRVTATNPGERTVSWGLGSSSCQLYLLVRLGGREYVAGDIRICSADRAQHVLAPGESRTETIRWTGTALRGDVSASREPLAPGTYEVVANAGSVATSPPVLVEVRTER